MVFNPEVTQVDYFERKDGREQRDTYPVDSYPTELKKKVNLLHYFTTYLPQKCQTAGVVPDSNAAAQRVAGQPLVLVRKYLKTRHAIFFRLSDNTMQVNFTDTTSVVLSARGTVVTYTDKKNQSYTMWLSDVSSSEFSASIFSRLYYIKDMLNCLIHKRSTVDAEPNADGNHHKDAKQKEYLFGEGK